jgi:hypothetical protein
MKIENHSAYLLDPATNKGQSYKFEVKFTKRDGLFWMRQKEKTPEGFEGGTHHKDFKQLHEIFKAKVEAWNDKTTNISKEKIIRFKFNAGIDEGHGGRDLPSNYNEDKYLTWLGWYSTSGCSFTLQYWVGYADTVAIAKCKRTYYDLEGNVVPYNRQMSTDREMPWTQEKEDFFINFNNSMTKRLKELAKFLEKDEQLLEVIYNSKQLPFFGTEKV